MDKCIKQGYLHFLISSTKTTKKWEKRFYVLLGFTETSTARLVCYASETKFKEQKRPNNTYCINDIADIRYRETPDSSFEHKHTCEVGCKKKVLVFSAPSSSEIQEWVMAMMSMKFESDKRKKQADNAIPRPNVIYEPLDIASRLAVQVNTEPTDASKRCHLEDAEYILHVCRADIVLMDAKSTEMKQQWFYRYIRAYSCTPSMFTIEAGRRCASGGGFFSFKTPLAIKLNAEVLQAVQALENATTGEDDALYMSMRQPSSTCTQERAEHTTTSASPTAHPAPQVCYVNICSGERKSAETPSPIAIGNLMLTSEQKHTEETTDTANTKTSGVQTAIYENIPADQKALDEWIYMVEIEETEASKRCKLSAAKYQLHIESSGMKLEDLTAKENLQDWPYTVIRRFGSSHNLFIIEVGRRAASGEGIFKFKTTTPDKLKAALVEKRGLQQTNSSTSPVVVEPNRSTPTGQLPGSHVAVGQQVPDQEPTTSIETQDGSQYTALCVGNGNVHGYIEVLEGPPNVPGRSKSTHATT